MQQRTSKMFSPHRRKKVMIMNRFICFDNLRSAAVVLTLAALLLQSWTAFYEESAVVAISIVFFISAYFGLQPAHPHDIVLLER